MLDISNKKIQTVRNHNEPNAIPVTQSFNSEKITCSCLELEEECNLTEISNGIANLRNLALAMNEALDRDSDQLNAVLPKTYTINTNLKKVSYALTKQLA